MKMREDVVHCGVVLVLERKKFITGQQSVGCVRIR